MQVFRRHTKICIAFKFHVHSFRQTQKWASALNLLTKVSKFELSGVTNEEVLGFQVAVKNVPLVDVWQTSQQLEKEELKNDKATHEQREVTLTYLFTKRIKRIFVHHTLIILPFVSASISAVAHDYEQTSSAQMCWKTYSSLTGCCDSPPVQVKTGMNSTCPCHLKKTPEVNVESSVRKTDMICSTWLLRTDLSNT